MFPLFRRSLIILCALALGFVLPGCQLLGGNEKPTVVIGAPASGTAYKAGQDIAVTSTATDPQGITRIELLVDSISVHTNPSPVAQGQAQFQVIQTWKATGAGTHTITVRAYNTQGAFGEAGITVTVGEDTALGPTPIQISTPAPISTVPPIPTSPNSTAVATAVQPTLPPPPTPPPTNTTAPTGCTPNSAYVADVTIPDGTLLTPGTPFTKAWRVLNNGSCTWDTSYAIMWVSGAQMAGQAVLPINPTSPGATVDLAIPMTAPTVPGVYTSIWRLRDSYGNPFGTNLTVVITVGNPAPLPTATRTPGPGMPVISYFSCNPCTIAAGQTTTLSWGAVTNATSASISPAPGGVGTPGTWTSPALGATTTFVLTAVGPGGTSQASVTVTVNPVANFAGFWYINFGTMSLTQSGASVTGTYFNAFDGNNGTIAGNISGNTLDGTWTKGATGSVHLVVSGNQITGYWNGTAANKWCGARTGVEFPNGCSFDGHWNIGGAISCGNMSMTLRRVDMTVTGTWCGSKTVTGMISYSGSQTVLTGTANMQPTIDPIVFYLAGYSGLQWKGHYVYQPGNQQGAFCGWRDGSSQPNPCKQ